MVSITKASKTTPTKTKRQSSIRRLAARLGAKAVRREVAVYKPSESVVHEDHEAEQQSTATDGSHGTRRSRRLLEQKEQPRPESKQSAVSRISGVGRSPSKSSKLKKEHKDASASPGGSSRTDTAAFEPGGAHNKPGTVTSLSLMMADWEIAPGRIRVGAGEDTESESTFPLFATTCPQPLSRSTAKSWQVL
jgi:hypothetical protein